MLDTEFISNLKKVVDDISKALDEFYNVLPKYLRTEILHPKKKPRGSMRRTRQEKLMPSVTTGAGSEDVLAEIKAEIEKHCCITVGSENEPAMTLYDVFQIIDKYRTGSEEIKDE